MQTVHVAAVAAVTGLALISAGGTAFADDGGGEPVQDPTYLAITPTENGYRIDGYVFRGLVGISGVGGNDADGAFAAGVVYNDAAYIHASIWNYPGSQGATVDAHPLTVGP